MTEKHEIDMGNLSLDQIILANERIYQAWLRTGLANKPCLSLLGEYLNLCKRDVVFLEETSQNCTSTRYRSG